MEEAEERETPDPLLQDPCGSNTCRSATATLEFRLGTLLQIGIVYNSRSIIS